MKAKTIEGYRVIDLQTRKQMGNNYAYAQRNRARARADKLDLEYGAHRYTAQPILN